MFCKITMGGLSTVFLYEFFSGTNLFLIVEKSYYKYFNE